MLWNDWTTTLHVILTLCFAKRLKTDTKYCNFCVKLCTKSGFDCCESDMWRLAAEFRGHTGMFHCQKYMQ